MLGWIYSDPVRTGFASGVTRGGQKFQRGVKTIVGTSNRFSVVTDVVYDGFMQWERPLGVERVATRFAATHRASPNSQVRKNGHPTASLGPSHQLAKSYGKITQNQDLGLLNTLSGRQMSGHASLLDNWQRRRKARGDSRDAQGSRPLHKIIIHNISNDPEPIRSVPDRFDPL